MDIDLQDYWVPYSVLGFTLPGDTRYFCPAEHKTHLTESSYSYAEPGQFSCPEIQDRGGRV